MFSAKQCKDELVQWIQDYFAANGKDCMAVIGISGGKDSSVVAALCAEALGAERVVGVMMPQGRQYDIGVSQELCAHLCIRSHTVQIEETVRQLYRSLERDSITPNDVVLHNTPARIRMSVLYAVSAVLGGRVANTSNLSEDWIGWATKYGDAAGDFGPLSLLTVTEVLAVGRALGLPDRFIDKVPEDGLTGKPDEENFGFRYADLDRYIREGVCEDAALKEKIDRLHQLSLHKVSPMPVFTPGCPFGESPL